MKKTIFSSVLMLVVLASASAAMASTSITGSTTLGNATNSFTPSAKVGIFISSIATSYAATSCHLNGTYQYGTVGGTGTAADPSKIYTKAIPSQSAYTIGTPSDTSSTTTDLPGGFATWQ
jgi:hypothetical protein